MDTLQVEIAHRQAHGATLVSVAQMRARFEAIGYKLDRSSDCRSTARYLESGRTYPACSTGVKETDTGRSAFHFESRRDDNFRRMQTLRNEVFAVSRNAILEV